MEGIDTGMGVGTDKALAGVAACVSVGGAGGVIAVLPQPAKTSIIKSRAEGPSLFCIDPLLILAFHHRANG